MDTYLVNGNMIKKFNLILILSIHFSLSIAQSQNVTVRGIISEYQTGQALELATVALRSVNDNEIKGAVSNENGLYQIDDIHVGKYIFSVRFIGYKTFTDTLQFDKSPQIVVKNIQLIRSSEELAELTVLDSTGDDIAPGQTRIRAEDFAHAPTPAGSADLASYLQTLPGVVATGDRGGQLFVRGGTPSENLVLLDGTLVYQPFHIVGFFSVFPEDVVSNVDFYAGGFDAEYRGRTSSVMDIRLKNGNLYNYNWSASVSPFVSDLFFEGPINEGKSSLMVSLRGSLIESTSDIYLAEQQPLRFNSQLIKYSNVSENGFNCSAHFLRTYDRGNLDFEEGDFFSWRNVATGGRCAAASESGAVSFTEINFGVSHFSNEAGNNRIPGRSSNINRSHLDMKLTQYTGNLELNYGFFTNLNTVNYDITNLFVSQEKNKEVFLRTGTYLSLEIPVAKTINIRPGISFTSYLARFPASFEPRIQVSWQPRGRVDEEIHAAAGLYRQALLGITDYRDAGTAFTVWMPMPESNRRMEAWHGLLGWRQPIGDFFDFSVEGYYKIMHDIPVSTWSTIAKFSTNLAYADGNIYGSDIRLNFSHRNIFFGLGYGYSFTEYETAQDHFGTWFGEPVQSYHPPHDRRHQLNAQAGLEIKNFKVNISWMYGSGLPFTRPMGFDSYFSFEERPPNVTEGYGMPRVLLEKPFEGKMPDFHRLDVSVEQGFYLPVAKIRVQGGAINTYDWRNLFYYDVFNQKGINQLPLIPYISLKIESI